MDDDTVVNYESLSRLLKFEEENHRNEMNIFCPSVMRNQKVWTYPDAPTLGKWAYNQEVPNATFLDTSKFSEKYRRFKNEGEP